MDTFSEAANAPGAFAPLLTMSKILPAAPCAGAPVGTAVTVLDDPALSLTMSVPGGNTSPGCITGFLFFRVNGAAHNAGLQRQTNGDYAAIERLQNAKARSLERGLAAPSEARTPGR